MNGRGPGKKSHRHTRKQKSFHDLTPLNVCRARQVNTRANRFERRWASNRITASARKRRGATLDRPSVLHLSAASPLPLL